MGRQAIRVANIIEEGRYGGPQARICSVAERLKGEEIETLIICPIQDSDRFSSEASERKIDICRIRLQRLSRSKQSVLRYFLSLPKEVCSLYKILKKGDIDIVHCNSARHFKGIIAGCLARKKVIWHLQDTWSPFVIKGLFLLTSKMATHYIAAGERVRKYYLENKIINRKPICIIRQPINTRYYSSNDTKPDEYINSFSGLKVTSIGNINPAKGFEYFIGAALILNKKHTDVTYILVGPQLESQEKYYNKLKSRSNVLNDKIKFYGQSSNVRSILKSSDIFVCSSVHESGPITLWEAMSMGKSVVSTDVGDVKHFIRDGENGFVVPTKDPKALAEKIEILLNDAELRKSFGAKARETAVEHLDISVCVQKHADFYRQILNEK